jgi:bacillithiol system protein YtxJ
MAFSRVESYEREAGEGGPPVFLVKVIESRPVSNAVAERLGVEHKSPQLILLLDGAARWSASHYEITVDRIREAVAEASVLGDGQ